MTTAPRIVQEQPTVENTVPLHTFRRQHPARYLQSDDQLILYAGSRCTVRVLDESPELAAFQGATAFVYVLDAGVLVWRAGGPGLELPYQLVALHAVKNTTAGSVLYLQVVCGGFLSRPALEFTQTVEILLEPSDDASVAFPALLTGNSPVEEMYNAMLTCSAALVDSEHSSEGEDEAMDFGAGAWTTTGDVEVPSEWIKHGDADDLGPDEFGEGAAGMDVQVTLASIAGQRRRVEQEPGVKQRRRD